MSKKDEKANKYLTRQTTAQDCEQQQAVDKLWQAVTNKSNQKEDNCESDSNSNLSRRSSSIGSGANTPSEAESSITDIVDILNRSDQFLDIMAAADAPITAEEMRELLSAERRKKGGIEPGKFGGLSSENASLWLRHFEQYATLQGLSEDEKLLSFGLLMKGIADLWYTNYYDRQKDVWLALVNIQAGAKWADVSEAFKRKFTKSKHINMQKLENIKISDFKDSEAYVNHLQQVGGVVGINDDALIPYIMRGLPDEMREMVASHEPETLADCISKVSLTETLIKMRKPKPEVKAMDISNDNKISSLAEAILQINDKIEQLCSNSTPRDTRDRNENRSDRPRQAYGRRREELRCHNCDKTGHFARDCWSRGGGAYRPNNNGNRNHQQRNRQYGNGQQNGNGRQRNGRHDDGRDNRDDRRDRPNRNGRRDD